MKKFAVLGSGLLIVVVFATVLYQFLSSSASVEQPMVENNNSVPNLESREQKESESTLLRQKPTSAPEDKYAELAEKLGISEQELAEKRKIEQYQRAAEQRFNETTELDGLTPEDVNPKVVNLFQTLKLSPHIDISKGREGYINGMVVESVSPRNALALEGFKVGDRIETINGIPLQDPAQIAHLFTTINDSIEICAVRESQTICKNIML